MAHESSGNLTRRRFLGAAGAAGVAGVAGAAGLTACSSGLKASTSSSGSTIKIGYVSPETGALSVFTQSNGYVLKMVHEALAKGITVGGKKYKVEIISKDSQSTSAGAATAASQLIQTDNVNIILATSTPDTVIPVSSQAEANGVPCVLTICPWEQWYYKSNGAANTFKYSYMYFLGTQEETDLFVSEWQTVSTNHVVGGLWPNDVDGAGFQKYMTAKLDSIHWKVVPSGAYTDGLSNFSSIISKFKNSNVEILHAVPIPPDFITFWRQAHEDGFKPKIASISKALLFPSVADALGPLVVNVMSPLWWSPAFPTKSSLTGMTSAEYASGYTKATGSQWAQPMGFNYAIFEVAVHALKASGDPTDAKAVAHTLATLKGHTITGAYDFATGPVPHVSQVPELLAQWRPAKGGGYELVVINNSLLPSVPVQGKLQLL
jgi:branched-chain amino acid transport system substrate-binding protein